MDLLALSLGLFVEKTWYALCASYIGRLYWCFVHPGISLLYVFLSHTHIFRLSKSLFVGSYVCSSTFFMLQVLLLLFAYLCSLAHVCVQKFLGGSDDSMLSTLHWTVNPTLCMYLGEFPLIIFNTFWILFACFCLGFFCNLLDPQYSFISLHVFFIGYVHLISLILWEMHTLWRSSYYIGLLNFSPISEIDANGGEV